MLWGQLYHLLAISNSPANYTFLTSLSWLQWSKYFFLVFFMFVFFLPSFLPMKEKWLDMEQCWKCSWHQCKEKSKSSADSDIPKDTKSFLHIWLLPCWSNELQHCHAEELLGDLVPQANHWWRVPSNEAIGTVFIVFAVTGSGIKTTTLQS